MWLKWLGGGFVIIGCSGLGIWYSIRFLIRYNILRELERGILILRGEISYGRTPLPQAFEQMAGRTGGTVSCFFQKIASLLEEGVADYETLWNKTIQEFFTDREMGAEDRKELIQLGNTVGYLDIEMQIQSLELYQNRLCTGIRRMEQEKEKYMKLYPVLGTMCGAILCIMML